MSVKFKVKWLVHAQCQSCAGLPYHEYTVLPSRNAAEKWAREHYPQTSWNVSLSTVEVYE